MKRKDLQKYLSENLKSFSLKENTLKVENSKDLRTTTSFLDESKVKHHITRGNKGSFVVHIDESLKEECKNCKRKLKEDYTGFLGNYGFDYLRGKGDFEYWYYKDKEDIDGFNKAVERIRKEYPDFVVSSSKSKNPTIYIQKSKYEIKESKGTLKEAKLVARDWLANFTLDGKEYYIEGEKTQTRDYMREEVRIYDKNNRVVGYGKDKWMNRPWYRFTYGNAFERAVRDWQGEDVREEIETAVEQSRNCQEAIDKFVKIYGNTSQTESLKESNTDAKEELKAFIDELKEETGLTEEEIGVWCCSNDMGYWFDEILDNDDTWETYIKAEKKLKNTEEGNKLLALVAEIDDFPGDLFNIESKEDVEIEDDDFDSEDSFWVDKVDIETKEEE